MPTLTHTISTLKAHLDPHTTCIQIQNTIDTTSKNAHM
jgi:hypothetical protein